MAWKNRPEHRCEHCGARICKNLKVKFNERQFPNKRKKCSLCQQRGCLFCMTGNAKHGILQHKDCDFWVGVAVEQLLFPSRHKLELSYATQLVGSLARLANTDSYMRTLLTERLQEAEPDSLFPLVFAFVVAPEAIPALQDLSARCRWADLALLYQRQYGEAQPASSVTSD